MQRETVLDSTDTMVMAASMDKSGWVPTSVVPAKRNEMDHAICREIIDG